MEQYIHTLITADSEFAPDGAQVASFLGELVSGLKFIPVSGKPYLPGLVVSKPSGKLWWGTNSMTGAKFSIPAQDHLSLETFGDIPASLENSNHYTVMQSGKWPVADRPLDLFKPDGVPF